MNISAATAVMSLTRWCVFQKQTKFRYVHPVKARKRARKYQKSQQLAFHLMDIPPQPVTVFLGEALLEPPRYKRQPCAGLQIT
jgi:hypothetical protein